METIDLVLHEEITLINQHIDNILKSDNKRMQEIIDWVLQSRGKQLRPKLVCICSKFGRANADATKMAAMLEIVHTASLVHDDIVDHAVTRRGNLSVQEKFGQHIAVYVGDYMIFCIVKEAIEDTNYRNYAKLYRLIQRMCYGELGQDTDLYQTDVCEERYLNNINGKTAALFQAACELGGITAKAAPAVVSALGEYGRNLGLLFQIRDDLLDYISSEQEIGKPILQDFTHGIYTLPVIYSFDNQTSREKLLGIADHIKSQGVSEEVKIQVLNIIETSDGIARTRLKAKEFYDAGLAALESLPEKKEKNYLKHILNSVYQKIEYRGV